MTTTGSAAAIVESPLATAAGRRRRATTWIVIAAVLIGVGIAGSVLAGIGQWTQRDVLDPDSAGPTGTRALVEILREHGVDVVVARDRATVDAALAGGGATLAITDAPYLSDEALRALTDAAADVVLIDPRARTLRLLLPGATTHGVGPGDVVDPECDDASAERAGAIAPGAIYLPGHADHGLLSHRRRLWTARERSGRPAHHRRRRASGHGEREPGTRTATPHWR